MRAEGGHRRSGTAPWAALVAVGGALGTLLRAALEAAHPAAPGGFPWTTFLINVVGAFLLGALQESLALSGPDGGWRKAVRIGVGTGVIGGFTTYSTFILEGDRLLTGSGTDTATGIAYVLGSVVAGLLSALLGIHAAGVAMRSRGGARSAPARRPTQEREGRLP